MAALALVIALLAAAESGGEVGATKHCGSGFMISALPQVVYDNQPSKKLKGEPVLHSRWLRYDVS